MKMIFSYLSITSLISILSILTSTTNAEQSKDNKESLVPLYSFSLNSPYIEESLQNRWWNYGGDTLVAVTDFVRLTPDAQSKIGWLWGKVPFTSQSWQIEIEFHVHGEGSIYGDGFAFWFTADKEVEGPVYGSKDYFTGLGVFFDTYNNGRHREGFPMINAMIGDGHTSYDHDNDGKPTEIGSCANSFRGVKGSRAQIKYLKGELLEVSITHGYHDSDGGLIWTSCFAVGNVTLPETGYLGFSAHTGQVHDNHDIISVSANGIINGNSKGHNVPPVNIRHPTSKKESEVTGSHTFWIVFLVLAGIAVVGYAIYAVQKQQTAKSLKRF